MLTYIVNEKNLLDTVAEFTENAWVHLSDPTQEELELVAKETAIPLDMLSTALDPEEFAHTDIEDGNHIVVLDIPVIEKENGNNVFSTVPIGLIFNDKCFVSVCLKETSIIKEFMANRIKGVVLAKRPNFMLRLIQRIEFKYLQYLKRIDKTSDVLQNELHKAVRNKELIDLMDLEKSLVYFSTSLTGNDRVLARMQKSQTFTKSEEDADLLDDVINDNKQANEMCNIYRDILSGMMDAFASVISNNLNIVMKVLTLVTIVLTIPMLVASFWGMNVPMPLSENPYGFWILLGISAVLAVVGGLILSKYSSSNGTGRKKK